MTAVNIRLKLITYVPECAGQISVGAKHDRSKYPLKTNNLYTGMLCPLQNSVYP